MFEPNRKRNNIKLYVRRFFIMDNCEEICPEWLAFIRGVVDSEDLPLNISRENLQQNKILKVIRKNVVKKAWSCSKSLLRIRTVTRSSMSTSGRTSSLAFMRMRRPNQTCELLRYNSTKSGEDATSLKDYVTRMKEGQKSIYYITGDSRKKLETSPFLEEASGVIWKSCSWWIPLMNTSCSSSRTLRIRNSCVSPRRRQV